MGKLYVVGTPIGHLEDLTFRAKRILSSAALIVCEDTRVTRKLLNHYEITVPVTSLHQHSDDRAIQAVLDRIEQGDDIAMVSDAGMPGLADPGGKVVAAAADRGLPIEVVPGPTALTAAIGVSGVPTDRFLFLGFLPQKKGRQTLFQRIADTSETVILYESPHRLMKTLDSLLRMIPDRPMVVCRELTKIYESTVRGRPEIVLQHFTDHPDQVRGEIVIVIGPT